MYATRYGDLVLERTYLINDDFDSDTAGANPSGWTVTEGAAYYLDVSTSQYYSSSNSVKFIDNDANSAIMQKTITGQTHFVVEFQAYLTNLNEWQFYGRETTAINMIMSFYNGNLQYHNGAAWQQVTTYSYNTWIHVMLLADTGTDTYDIYVDDMTTPKVSGAAFYAACANIARIEFRSGSTSTGVEAYLDDVFVYSYNTPGTYTSASITSSEDISAATLSWSATLYSQTMTISVSRDGGTTWTAVSNGVEYGFTGSEPAGKVLRYRVQMSTTDTFYSPFLHSITMSYATTVSLNYVTFTGESSGDKFGWSVHGAGNVGAGLSGDSGIDDIIIGAPYRNSGAGAIYIFNGSTTLSGTIGAANADYYKAGPQTGGHYGWSVCKAGNIDDDAYNDVIVGSPDQGQSSADSRGWAQVLCVIIPVPEFRAELVALVPPMAIIPAMVYRRKRKSLSYVGSTEGRGAD
jgi:hypothetical protein